MDPCLSLPHAWVDSEDILNHAPHNSKLVLMVEAPLITHPGPQYPELPGRASLPHSLHALTPTPLYAPILIDFMVHTPWATPYSHMALHP